MKTSIRFVAVIKGVPLKNQTREGPYPGNQSAGGPVSSRNEASVDSELKVLVYFRGKFPVRCGIHISRASRQSQTSIIPFITGLPGLIAKGRNGAPNDVDSFATEKRGLRGRAYVDGARETAAGYRLATNGSRKFRSAAQSRCACRYDKSLQFFRMVIR